MQNLLAASWRIRVSIGAALCAGLLITCVPLAAQTASGGSIGGYITDMNGGALVDVLITVIDSTGASRTTRTDSVGYYHVQGLSPTSYTVSSAHVGFNGVVRGPVDVREGLSLNVDFSMVVGSTAEFVRVDADTPLLEWKTATQGMNISGDLQRRLPLSSLRTWADFLQLAPGVAIIQTRFQTYSLYGSGNASGVFLVDGADATSVLQGSPLYAQFSRETFADIQVKTGLVEASSPLGLGAVVNVATRSGGNRFQGAAALAYQPERWNDRNAPAGRSSTLQVAQGDGALGGPLQRGGWWFFGSGRVSRNETGISRSAQQMAYLTALAPDFQPFDNQWDEVAGFAKVTSRLSGMHDLLISYSRERVTFGGAQPNEAGLFRTLVVGGPSYYARMSSVWHASFLTRLSVGYNGRKQHNSNLRTTTSGVNVYQSVLSAGGRAQGVGLLATLEASPFPSIDFPVSMSTITADANWYRSDRSGAHDIQVGVSLQPRRHNEWITRYNNGGSQLEEFVLRDPTNAAAGTMLFHRQVFGVDEITTANVDTRDHAVYMQDTWRPLRRLTVSVGLRVDLIESVDKIFSAVTQRSTEIGPRFGVNYRLTADDRNSVRFGWNRVHENLSVNGAQAGANLPGVTDFYDPEGDGSFTAFVTPGRTALSSNIVVDRGRYHQGYVNELAGSYRRQLPARTSVGASVLRREYRDRPALVETNSIYDGDVFAGYRDVGQNEIYQLTANRWNWPVATSMSVEASKEGTSFQAIGAYTRVWSRLAGTWQPHDPAAIIQPDAFANRNGIGFVSGCTTLPCSDSNSLSGDLGSGAWRGHVAKLGVSYYGPWRMLVATSYTLQSGPWSGPILTRLPTPDPKFGPATLTLSNGRVVSNPLATPIRFAYPTRGDGQLSLGALHIWSVRVGRQLSIGATRLELTLDVFNMTNHAADQSFQFGGNQQFSPFFGQASSRQFPRVAQASARLIF